MKKFLSLVLALVMAMSLVTISAGAKDFTDDSTINYEEAVDVISALKVVEGYPDGSFGPSKGLTRAEAAKIICNMILGPTTASALSADAAPFKDVPVSHWAAGYIAFCVKEGIIDGYGNGNFGPSDALTGYAYMKLLLGALGYDKDIEGYTGPNWSVNVAKRALNIGLDDGLTDDFNGVKDVTREEAVLFAFNTLTADMVEYGSKTTVTVGGAEVVVGAGEAKKIVYSDNKDYRESVCDNDKDDGYQQFCEAYFSKLTLDDKNGIRDAFGRPANTWYIKNEKVGTYAKDADLIYTKDVEAQDLYKDLDLNRDYDFEVVVDGITDASSFWAIKKAGHGQAKDDKIDDVVSSSIGVGNGSKVEVFEDDGIITVMNTFLMQVNGDYDEKNDELDLATIAENNYPALNAGALTLSADDFDNLDSYKDEDYVIVTIANGDIQSIALAEKVTAAVTEYVHEEELTAGGKAYEYAVANNDNDKAYALKEDYNLFLDPYGYVLWADGVDVDDQYVFIYEFSQHSTSAKAAVNAYGYFTDGTEAEMEIAKIDGTKVNASQVVAGTAANDYRDSTANGETTGWYKFVKKDTGKYELTSIAAQTNPGNGYAVRNGAVVNYDTTHTVINDGAQTKDGNKATIFVVLKANGDVVAYEGIKNVANITGGTNTVVDMYWDGRYAKCVFVDLKNGTITGGSNSSDIVFFYKNNSYANDTDDDNYYIYKAIVNGELTKVKLEQTAANSALRGLYTDIEYSSKNFIVGKTLVDGVSYPVGLSREDFTYDAAALNTAPTVDLKKNTLVINGVDYYLADSYQIFVIDGSSVDTYTAKQLDKDAATILAAPGAAKFWSVSGVMNSDNEYTALYIYD